MGTQDNAASGCSKDTFGTSINELSFKGLNAVRKVLSLPHKDDSDQDYTAEMKTKDLSSFMAYSASLAFFAYKKPYAVFEMLGHVEGFREKEVGYEERLSDGSISYYLSKKALTKSAAYVIKIHLRSATNVPNKDTRYVTSKRESDPYVLFQCGRSMVKSKAIRKTNEPTWDSFHYIVVKKETIEQTRDDRLYVYVIDKDSRASLGRNEIGIVNQIKRLDDVIGSKVIRFDRTNNKTFEVNTMFKTENEVDLSFNRASKSPPLKFENQFDPKLNWTLDLSAEIIKVEDFLPNNDEPNDFIWMDDYHIPNSANTDPKWPSLLEDNAISPIKVSPLVYFDQGSTSTQAWLYGNLDEHVLVLAFPGTDVVEDLADDSATSLNAFTVALDDIVADDLSLAPKVNSKHTQGQVHKGYLKAYSSLRPILLDTLYSITGWREKWLIAVIGHSLGGSLATLGAYDISNRVKDGSEQPKVAMFTFGAPALSNDAMCPTFSSAVPLGFRVVADDDAVANTMHDPLKRLGKVFPCNARTGESFKHILTTPTTDPESSETHVRTTNRNVSASEPLFANWGPVLGALPQKEKKKHLERNYFNTIQGFLKVVFS